jgi:endonuclease/exonuclease/phosphatase family metal-dependent hydrolase
MKKKKNSSLTPVKNKWWLDRPLQVVNLLLVALSLGTLLTPYADPNYFWVLAVLGLGTPIFLFLHLCFMLFWLLRKKRYAVLSIGILLMSWPAVEGLVGLNSQQTAQEDLPTFKLVTYNVRSLKSYTNQNKTISPEAFKAAIAPLQPDVLCLQEFAATNESRQPYLNTLQSLGLQYFSYSTTESSRLMIASRFPLQTIKAHTFGNSVNGYLMAEVNLDGKKFNLINVHLRSNYVTGLTNQIADEGNLNEKETWRNIRQVLSKYKAAAVSRSEQAEQIAAELKSFKDPAIICGDFNDTGQSYSYRILKDGYYDAFIQAGQAWGASYAGKIPGLRIDYILYAPLFKALQCRREKAAFSDHHPVSAQLQIP